MVKVYITDVSYLPDPKVHPEIMDGLSDERKEKIKRYRQEKNRKQSLGAGLLLKKCLGECGIDTEEIFYGENGKPEVQDLYFNVSHSHNIVVCVISSQAVGCDIEKVEDLREGIAERFFTENEIKYLSQFTGDVKGEEFYRLWTMKESYMKMTGEGMRVPLNSFEFRFDNEISVFRDGKLCECYIKEYYVQDYKLTVCAKENAFEENIEKVIL